jgi:tetratricopeptide (TPR) repeat protein
VTNSDTAHEYFHSGTTSFEAGHFRDAIDWFTKAIAAAPQVVAGYRARAKAHLALNERPAAIADFSEAIKRQPNDAQLRMERAAELLRQKCYAEAIADCDLAESLDPARADVCAVRGRCRARSGDTPGALADYATAMERDPDHVAEYRLHRGRLFWEAGNAAQAIAEADAILLLDPDFSPAYELRALARQHAGDRDGARLDFHAWLAREPDSLSARMGLATLELDAERFAEALELIEPVIAREPRLIRALEIRAVCLSRLHRIDDALAQYESIVPHLPGRAWPHHRKAQLHLLRGAWRDAVNDHMIGVSCEPDDWQGLNDLAWSLATVPDDGLRHGPKAVELAKRAVALTDEQNAACWDTLAAAFAECGEFDHAGQAIARALGLATDESRRDFELRQAQYLARQPFRLSRVT